jgi:outer membrane protein TolC
MTRVCLVSLSLFFLQLLAAQEQNLDYYLSRGLQNSPLLVDYQNRLKSARYDSMRINASQKIQVNGRSVDYYAPVIHGWGYDEVVTDGANVAAVVEVSRQFTGKSNLLNQHQSVQLRNQSTILEAKVSEKDLRKSIVAQYIDTYGDQQQYQMNHEVLGILKDEEKLVRQLTEQGVYKQTQYLALLVNLRQQEILTEQSYNQCEAGLGTLNYLCGIYDTAWVVLPDPGIAASALPEVRNSVFYRQYETDSLKLVTADKLIDFNYRPKLSAYVEGGYFSSLTYMPWKNFGTSSGLSLNVPIYDGRQKKMQHDQIAVSEQTRLAYRNFFTLQYRQQTDMLYRELAANEKLFPQYAQQILFAQTLVDANQKLLNSGDVSVTDYLLAISNYHTARNLLIDNQLKKYHILNEINYWSKTK